MDTKVIAMVGAVIVVGAAVYGVATGTVLPGTEDISEDGGGDTSLDNNDTGGDTSNLDDGTDDGEQENGDSGDENDVGDGGSEGNPTPTGDGNESEGETGGEEVLGGEDDEEGESTELSEDTPDHICEETESELTAEDLRNRKMAIGPPFDPLKFESMLHDRINKLRERRAGLGVSVDLLDCDPELREIAREHSELVLKSEDDDYDREVNIESAAVRYEGVCESPRERHGTWYYQRDLELNSPDGGDGDQRLTLIKNHEDLVRDVRGAWGESGSFVSDVTDSRMKRQGIGAYIDRDTRKVVVTQVLCGEQPEETETEEE
jgi:hypothetical protein